MLVDTAVLAALCAAVLAGLLVCVREPSPLRRRLLVVVGVALGLRVALALLLHALGPWSLTDRGAVTPDEAVIDYAARLRARGDTRSPVVLGGSLHTAWLLVAAALYEVWDSLLALKLVNGVLGALLVVPAFLLGRDLHSDRAGTVAAWAVALYPNAVVWSALALREPLIALVLTTLVLVALRMVGHVASRRTSTAWLAVVVAAVVVLGFTRSYMVPLMLLLVLAAGALAALTRGSPRPALTAVTATVLALLSVLAVPRGAELAVTTLELASEQAPSVYNPLSDCSDESACLAVEAGPPTEALPAPSPSPSAAGPSQTEPEPEPALSDSLQSVGEKGLVRAVAIAVLAGRPVWRTDEFFFLLQPGVVVWWTGLPLVAAGSVVLVRRRRWPELVLVGGFVTAVIVFLAYSGQFVRHHYMLEPIGLVLAAVGAVAVASSPHRAVRLAVAGACALMGGAALISVGSSLLHIG